MLDAPISKPESKSSPYALSHVPPDELISALKRLVAAGNQLTARLLAHIGEVDARRLYAQAACPSMFAYCTGVLQLSEGAAYKRIHAARAARRHPIIYEYLASGRLHLAGVCLLAPHLTGDNCEELLEAASGRTKREVEKLIAGRFPSPDVPPRVRALPRPLSLKAPSDLQPIQASLPPEPASPRPTPPAPPPASGQAPRAPQPGPDTLAPLSERRYRIQLTASQSLHDKLREAQDLFGHQVQPGDLAGIFERALDLLLRDLRKKRFAMTDRPRKTPAQKKQAPEARHIPNAVRREVAERDGYQCTYVDPDTGRRCPARSNLEFHHVLPRARGGRHDPENLRLTCRTHNQHAAIQDYGKDFMARHLKQARQADAGRRAETNCSRG
jgi:5-methylcytosine-specific restriction endonuclease McrA